MTVATAPLAGDDHRDELANPDPATVTVWSDLSCPWATLALHTLHNAATERGVDLLIDHRAFPLELFNRSPTPKELVDAEVTVIAGRIPDLGWQLWHGPPHAYPATLLPAMEAVQAAKDPACRAALTSSAPVDSRSTPPARPTTGPLAHRSASRCNVTVCPSSKTTTPPGPRRSSMTSATASPPTEPSRTPAVSLIDR